MLGGKKWVDWDLVREMDLWVFGKKWGGIDWGNDLKCDEMDCLQCDQNFQSIIIQYTFFLMRNVSKTIHKIIEL